MRIVCRRCSTRCASAAGDQSPQPRLLPVRSGEPEQKVTAAMRWARFDQNGTPSYGVVEGDEVIPVRGSPFDAWERTGTRLPLAEREAAVAGGATDLLRRRPELCRACARGGREARPEGGAAEPGRCRLPRQQRADRARRGDRDPQGRHRPGAVRRRAGRRDRPQMQAPDARQCAVRRARLHDRQRRQRAHLAKERPHAVAGEEHRHVQADGTVDRDQREA